MKTYDEHQIEELAYRIDKQIDREKDSGRIVIRRNSW